MKGRENCNSESHPLGDEIKSGVLSCIAVTKHLPLYGNANEAIK